MAEHERVTLDAAYQLPVRQFLNDLAYIKEFGKYKEDMIKKVKPK